MSKRLLHTGCVASRIFSKVIGTECECHDVKKQPCIWTEVCFSELLHYKHHPIMMVCTNYLNNDLKDLKHVAKYCRSVRLIRKVAALRQGAGICKSASNCATGNLKYVQNRSWDSFNSCMRRFYVNSFSCVSLPIVATAGGKSLIQTFHIQTFCFRLFIMYLVCKGLKAKGINLISVLTP